MRSDDYIPRRGDLVWISFIPQTGREQSGRLPAVVLSPQTYNDRVGLALLCPVTSQIKDYPWEVRIPEGLAVRGVVLADQVKVWTGGRVKPDIWVLCLNPSSPKSSASSEFFFGIKAPDQFGRLIPQPYLAFKAASRFLASSTSGSPGSASFQRSRKR
jgi:mRNA interferase MazF